jgi:2'-5' RNA ligase
MRSFVAVEIPTRIRKALGDLEEGLRRSGADVKWVRPESIHLTLKFLGEIDPGRVEEIREAVAGVLGRHEPFEVRVCGVGCFPRMSQPRVVWVGLTGEETRLLSLQGEVEGALERLGFPREERPFRAHLTLGRVRSSKEKDRLAALIQSHLQVDLGEFTVGSVIQFRSELHPTGARYTPLWEASLGASTK